MISPLIGRAQCLPELAAPRVLPLKKSPANFDNNGRVTLQILLRSVFRKVRCVSSKIKCSSEHKKEKKKAVFPLQAG